MTETYEVLALKYGEMKQRFRHHNFIMDDDHLAPMPIDYFIWVIRNAHRTIVVDCGFDHEEAKSRGRKITSLPREVLANIGIDAATVETLIVSHLHYDHAGTLGDFGAARFHIQDAEMAYATGRCMCDDALKMPFTVDHVCQMVKNVFSGRVQFHDGDGEVAPGVTVHHVPGHSKGMQAVRVMTEAGPLVLAVDATHFYENFERRKPFPILHSMEQMLRSYDRLEALAGGKTNVVPGHDPLVLARYPAWKPETEGIVHRLDRGRIA
ncbi:MAG: N-acyl homoserine lactonase family protein [Hyphomicrobiaceae bacterium]